MRETVFRFVLRIDSENAAAHIESLKKTIVDLRGVVDAEAETTDYRTLLAVRIGFTEPEDAKKLHRKVMNILIRHEGVTVLQVESNLTDIFQSG